MLKNILFLCLLSFAPVVFASGVGGSTGVGGTPSVFPGNIHIGGKTVIGSKTVAATVPLRVYQGASGALDNASATMTVESNTGALIQFMAPETSSSGFAFSSATGALAGSIQYTVSTHQFMFTGAAGAPVFNIGAGLFSAGLADPGSGILNFAGVRINGNDNQAYRAIITGTGACTTQKPSGWLTSCSKTTTGVYVATLNETTFPLLSTSIICSVGIENGPGVVNYYTNSFTTTDYININQYNMSGVAADIGLTAVICYTQ